MDEKIKEWLQNQEHLPEMLKDFHDQKDLFKRMHSTYRGSDFSQSAPSWMTGQIYTIDWFLWYMAQRGYILQKSKKKLPFKDFD